MKKEFRFSGIGGQGIILLGTILGRALSLYENLNVVQTMYYSAAYRGGLTTTDIIVTDEELYDLTAHQPTYLVLTAKKAFAANKTLLTTALCAIIDTYSIPLDDTCKKQMLSSFFLDDFYNLAQKHKLNPRSANMIMLGIIAKQSGMVSEQSVIHALCDVQKKEKEDNMKAISIGFHIIKNQHGV